MKPIALLVIALFSCIANDYAQVSITPDHSQPDRSAIYYNADDVSRNSGAMKTNGFSARCIKD